MGEEEMPEYEKRRLARISENKARLEALGLSRLASSLISSSSKQQSKARSLKTSKDKTGVDHEDDEEYRPSDDDGGLEKNDNVESSEDSEEVEEDARVSSCSRSKGKKRSSLIAAKGTRGTTAKEGLNESYFINDEEALMQAISLSLGVTTSNSPGTCVGISQNFVANVAVKDRQGKIYKAMTPGFAGRKKARNLDKARVQLTEDEMVAYFFSFDEIGKGYITPRDVKKMVTAHDFSWSDNEIAHMIHCFDRDEDGKLSLEDFRSIVSRCKMLQGTSTGDI